MRNVVLASAFAVLLTGGLSGCQTIDKSEASPFLPDAITVSLGSTVEYNKLCQSTGVKVPAGCRRTRHPNMDAERAADGIVKLNKGTSSPQAEAPSAP